MEHRGFRCPFRRFFCPILHLPLFSSLTAGSAAQTGVDRKGDRHTYPPSAFRGHAITYAPRKPRAIPYSACRPTPPRLSIFFCGVFFVMRWMLLQRRAIRAATGDLGDAEKRRGKLCLACVSEFCLGLERVQTTWDTLC